MGTSAVTLPPPVYPPRPQCLTAITFNNRSSGLAERINKGLEENATEGRKGEVSNTAIATTHVTLYIAIVCPLTFWRRNYFLNFSTPCISNVNNTGTKYVRIMKQIAF